MALETIINVDKLTLNDIESLEIKQTIKIESNGDIVNDTWQDIPDKLSILLGNFIQGLWKKSWCHCFHFQYKNKKYSLWHGNTKWFSLTRIE